MNYEELSLKGFIDEVKEVSSGPHPRRFCFVLGAGASRTSGIKSGQELVNIWDKELSERNLEEHLKWRKEKGITDTNKDSFYSEYYERRFRRQPVDGYNYLEKLMEHAKPSIGYVMLSYLLTKTKHNVVITTNFDHLTEDAISYYTQTLPLTIGHETLAHYVSKQINRPTIIKIHRDLLFDPKSRTDELQALHENWKKALGLIFAEYHPIFIGYAGNDKSLMDFLIKNSDKFINGEWAFPYWLMYKTDKIEGKVLEFLNSSDGYVVRHNGFDEVLYMLGAAFDYKLPLKEEFLSDAQKRFQELSDYIDEFSEKAESGNGILQVESDSVDESEHTETPEMIQAIQQITSQTDLQRMYREIMILHNDGKYAEALEINQKLIEIDPDNARYHNSLSVVLYRLERYEDALVASKRAVELETDNAQYYNNLGSILRELERYEEAIEQKKRALELESNNAGYHNSLGITLRKMGKYEEAVQELQRAVELAPENIEYQDNLKSVTDKIADSNN